MECHTGMNPAFHDLLADLQVNIMQLRKEEDAKASSMFKIVEEEVQRFSNESASGILHNVCKAIWQTGLASGISPTTQLATTMFDKIRKQFTASEAMPNGVDELHNPYRQNMEKLAVERAVSTLQEYYDVGQYHSHYTVT